MYVVPISDLYLLHITMVLEISQHFHRRLCKALSHRGGNRCCGVMEALAEIEEDERLDDGEVEIDIDDISEGIGCC